MKNVKMNSTFEKQNQWLHEIDPRIKLLWLLSYVVVFFTDNLFLLIIACSIAITIFIILKSHRSIYRHAVVLMILFLSILGLGLLIKYFINRDINELTAGALMIIKWLSIILSSVAFFVISSPYEIGIALRGFRVPKIAAFSVGIGFRFIPIVVDEFNVTLLAQKARGLDAERGFNSLRKVHLILKSLTIPLLRSLIIKMDNMWISLNLRGVKIESYLFKERGRFKAIDFLIASYSMGLIVLSVLF